MDDCFFVPHPLLRNAHIMTIVPALRLGRHQRLRSAAESVLVEVARSSKILVHCHKFSDAAETPTIVLVHGLEGSSCSPYLLNITAKALGLGFNVVRVNLRNCGGTLHLSPTLYNAGMSDDVIVLADYLREVKGLRNIYLVGYSLGGNIVLKAAAELGLTAGKKISGVCAVSPSLDLDACVSAIERGVNRLYEIRFLIGLKAKIREKSKFFPDLFDLSKLPKAIGLRSFDELFTAPDAGYDNALDYYRKASSLPMLEQIAVPTLIIAAQDDPIVPFASFLEPQLKSKFITLLSPAHGGHGGFVHHSVEKNDAFKSRDRFWAENRVLAFCLRI